MGSYIVDPIWEVKQWDPTLFFSFTGPLQTGPCFGGTVEGGGGLAGETKALFAAKGAGAAPKHSIIPGA